MINLSNNFNNKMKDKVKQLIKKISSNFLNYNLENNSIPHLIKNL